jgi:hypothetical protein
MGASRIAADLHVLPARLHHPLLTTASASASAAVRTTTSAAATRQQALPLQLLHVVRELLLGLLALQVRVRQRRRVVAALVRRQWRAPVRGATEQGRAKGRQRHGLLARQRAVEHRKRADAPAQ